MSGFKKTLKRSLPKPAYDFLGKAYAVANRPIQKRMASVTSSEDHPAGMLHCTVAYNRYGSYCVPLATQHRPACQAILKGRVYEPDTLKLLRRHLAHGGDVIHAGAFFGDFLPALSTAARHSTIWAFEPNPESFKCAEITAQINGLENVKLANAALGAKGGMLSMRIADDQGRNLGGWSQVARTSKASEQGVIQVEVVAIDEFFPTDRRVAVIQLDVEGFEQHALEGAIRTISRWRPLLVLEVADGGALIRSDWFKDTIMSLGYIRRPDVHWNAVFDTNGQSDS